MYSYGYSGYNNPYPPGRAAVAGRRPAAGRRRTSAGHGARLQLLPADQHDRRSARADRRRPGDLGVRPGPRGVQGGRLCQCPATRPAGADADAQRHDAARVPRLGALRAGPVRAGRGAALCGTVGRTRLGLDHLERDVSRRRDLYGAAPQPGSVCHCEPQIGSGPLRAGLPVPLRGARRKRRRPAQAGREAPAGRHALGEARRTVPASGGTPPAPALATPVASPAVDGKLAGKWAASPAKDAKIALAIQDDGRFTWAARTRASRR